MVIDDFNVMSVALMPFKANTPPVVDPNAVLPLTISAQGLQPVGRWEAKIVQVKSGMKHDQLPFRLPLDIMGQLFREPAFEDVLGLFAFE